MAGSNSGIMYHLVQQTLWEQCKASNTPYYPPTYEQVSARQGAPQQTAACHVVGHNWRL